ncbi:MAG: hypothetical protein CM1200mP26_26770 [Acidimicrobiales bacterium]|nr:MAG: hypothetical protein CM1200mP26_26770 [Acidimicrobiales bacterium]
MVSTWCGGPSPTTCGYGWWGPDTRSPGIARTDDVLVTLDGMNGLVAVDDDTGRVRVRAGTRLSVLNPALQARGLAMEKTPVTSMPRRSPGLSRRRRTAPD